MIKIVTNLNTFPYYVLLSNTNIAINKLKNSQNGVFLSIINLFIRLWLNVENFDKYRRVYNYNNDNNKLKAFPSHGAHFNSNCTHSHTRKHINKSQDKNLQSPANIE